LSVCLVLWASLPEIKIDDDDDVMMMMTYWYTVSAVANKGIMQAQITLKILK